MYPVIQLGNVSVSVYALLIVAGIAAGCIAMRPFSASFGIEKEDALYATLFGVLGAAVCGKLAYVLVSLPAADSLRIFKKRLRLLRRPGGRRSRGMGILPGFQTAFYAAPGRNGRRPAADARVRARRLLFCRLLLRRAL